MASFKVQVGFWVVGWAIVASMAAVDTMQPAVLVVVAPVGGCRCAGKGGGRTGVAWRRGLAVDVTTEVHNLTL